MNSRYASALVVSFFVIFSGGCGTLRGGARWGEDVTLRPGWERVRKAAKGAATDPWTWVPAAGFVVLSIGKTDQGVSDWAIRRTPIYGSPGKADDRSDDVRDALAAAALATSVMAASGDDPGAWATSKAKGLGLVVLSRQLRGETVTLLKGAIDRERPDKSSRTSSPSRHATFAFGDARLAALNVDSIDMPDWLRTPAKTAFGVAAFTASWSRIEGGQHFPSDVFLGATIGNFLSRFFNDAFMGLPGEDGARLHVAPYDDGLALGLRWSF